MKGQNKDLNPKLIYTVKTVLKTIPKHFVPKTALIKFNLNGVHD